jgi:hypothetical protein
MIYFARGEIFPKKELSLSYPKNWYQNMAEV